MVLGEISRAATWPLPEEIKVALLGLIPKNKQRKMSRKFVQLGLVLAKRRIAIKWLSRGPLEVEERGKNMLEWALAD